MPQCSHDCHDRGIKGVSIVVDADDVDIENPDRFARDDTQRGRGNGARSGCLDQSFGAMSTLQSSELGGHLAFQRRVYTHEVKRS